MGDEVATDGSVAQSQIALHVATTLAHAMHLGLFQVDALFQSSPTYDSSNGEDSLSAHTAKDYILFHDFENFICFDVDRIIISL
jgi:hypothetical protein